MVRVDGRDAAELREVKIQRNFLRHAEGSVLIEMGDTKVICAATVDEKVPPFLKGEQKGWINAEYAMLPRATQVRTIREVNKGKPGGRTMEIQRLIGRALRSVVDLHALGERTVMIDCDVIQADGGTRTAAVTGSFIALVEALQGMVAGQQLERLPVKNYLAAVSVGKVAGQLLLDLCFAEDSHAEVDMNVIMNGSGELVEIQGTAEGAPFSRAELDQLLGLAGKGIDALIALQRDLLGVQFGGN